MIGFSDEIDWYAVECVASERIRMNLNTAERREVVRRLADKVAVSELVKLLGVTERTVERDKARLHGRAELAAC